MTSITTFPKQLTAIQPFPLYEAAERIPLFTSSGILDPRRGLTNVCDWPVEILHLVMTHLDLGSMLNLALACRYMKASTLRYFIANPIEQAAVKSFFVRKVVSLLRQRRLNNVRRAYLNKHEELKLDDSSCLVYLPTGKA